MTLKMVILFFTSSLTIFTKSNAHCNRLSSPSQPALLPIHPSLGSRIYRGRRDEEALQPTANDGGAACLQGFCRHLEGEKRMEVPWSTLQGGPRHPGLASTQSPYSTSIGSGGAGQGVLTVQRLLLLPCSTVSSPASQKAYNPSYVNFHGKLHSCQTV